ncbi:hypothetical protein Ahy_B04g072150 [Arachis hypogaea]|uniref:Aminotransferase-like plant mobile domain-containing protein n=1 Tax=Arachis hypogaea TaxID=3818 RepID=A0A444ZML6_ARAHY|nr:hypothetical protein Ahy_B04g072150 [Arachis hypogaea]
MPKRRKIKDVNRPELHIANYLDHPNYNNYNNNIVTNNNTGSRMLQCDHYMPPDRYNPIVEGYEALEAECLDQFGVAPRQADCRGSFIKLTWFRALKDRLVLADDIQIQRYVKCHIMLLFGTVIFGDKSGAGVHWKFLPLLRNFAGIIQFSWGSACLAHLYRALCRATRVDCKEIDGPLTLLLAWAWIRLPFLAPIPSNPRIFPIANRWHNWERENWPYRLRKLEHLRGNLDALQEGKFVWEPYAIGRTDPDVIPADIRQHSAIWSATVPLISFECIEWHASDRVRRQFGLTQGVPPQECDLGEAHGQVLTGPKNQDWSGTHSAWVMHWMNRFSHVLVQDTVPSQNQLDIYLHWYRRTYSDHLHLSQLGPEENQHGDPMINQENQQESTGESARKRISLDLMSSVLTHTPDNLHLCGLYKMTPFNSSNESVNGIIISNGFSHTNLTPSDVCNKIWP